jgi:ArsR family transcriptional regulator
MVAVASHDEQVTTAARVRAHLSAPIEILFALYFLGKLGHRHPDARLLLRDADPELADRAMAFWSDAPGDFTEIVVFAHVSGTLFEATALPFLEKLEQTAASSFEIPDLPGEEPEDAAAIRRHILELRNDAQLRRRYVDLLRKAWDVLGSAGKENEATGRRHVDELSARLAAMAWRDAVPEWSIAWCTVSEPLLDPAAEHGELHVVPMFINDRGKFILSMPGMTVLSYVPGEKPPDYKISRHTAESIAGRHKIASDPTRLQILGSLIKRSATVSELADMYDLSQPTVSVHMKQLREAGLVTAERRGAQVMYRTDPVKLRELLGDADLLAR